MLSLVPQEIEKEKKPAKGFINFFAAKQRTLNAKVAEKTKKRGAVSL